MKSTNRPFLVAFLLILTLVCAVGASRPIKDRFNSLPDCAGQCRESYDAMIERCNRLPGARADKCREIAQKQYDNCLERCKGGNAPSPGR
jgi:hypothetical protein